MLVSGYNSGSAFGKYSIRISTGTAYNDRTLITAKSISSPQPPQFHVVYITSRIMPVATSPTDPTYNDSE